MEQILKGGNELIFGGGGGVFKEVLDIFINGIFALIAGVILYHMMTDPPSNIFGQIAYIFGALIVAAISFILIIRGGVMVFKRITY